MTRRDRADLQADARALLRCPICGGDLEPSGDAGVRCPERHTFDFSKHGYLALLGGRKATSGDDDDMARARERFLDTGAYDPVRAAVADLAAPALTPSAAGPSGTAQWEGAPSAAHPSDPTEPSAPGPSAADLNARVAPVILDVGAGTGHYLASALERTEDARGIALDTSPRALRVAARAHPRILAATWDVFKDFPMRNGSANAILDVFAPRNPAEFHRVLKPSGRLVVARPTDRHLAELRDEVAAMVSIDPEKEQRLERALSPRFAELETRLVEERIELDAQQASDLIGMTPSARHLDATSAIDEGLGVTISVLVTAYAPR